MFKSCANVITLAVQLDHAGCLVRQQLPWLLLLFRLAIKQIGNSKKK